MHRDRASFLVPAALLAALAVGSTGCGFGFGRDCTHVDDGCDDDRPVGGDRDDDEDGTGEVDGSCRPGEPCELACVAGGCHVDCREASSCDVDCVSGGCQVLCGPGQECVVDCVGGGCEVDCGGAASCDVDCVAGDCDVACRGAACDVSCVAGSCDVER